MLSSLKAVAEASVALLVVETHACDIVLLHQRIVAMGPRKHIHADRFQAQASSRYLKTNMVICAGNKGDCEAFAPPTTST